jgi:hypothetical protein
MDNQTPDKNSQVSLTQIYTNFFASRRSKTLLFIGALVIALVISAFVSGMGISDLLDSFAITGLILFPAGLIKLIFPPGQDGYDLSSAAPIFVPGALILWVVYLGIILNGITRENIRTSKILFLVFVLLLLLNVGGCAY